MLRTAIGGYQNIPSLYETTSRFKLWQDTVGKDNQAWHKNKKSSAGEDT
jgi:hypothetical protein